MVGRDTSTPVPVGRIEEPAAPEIDAGDADRICLVEALGSAPVEIDEIIRFTKLKLATVHLLVLELDLAGRIARHPGGRISLLP